MKLTDRLIAIDANLDDLQAGIEAGSRAAATLRTDTTRCKGELNTTLLRSIVRHVSRLQSCAREQQLVMRELRDGISRLRQEMKRVRESAAAAKLPSVESPDR